MKKLIIAASIALVGFTLTSCEKEEIQEPITSTKTIKEKPTINKSGGGEEEDFIIIYGVTQNTNSSPIAGAKVILFDSGTSSALDTVYSDTQGDFIFTDQDSGSYYFKATAMGYIPLTTNSMSFPASNSATLVLQE